MGFLIRSVFWLGLVLLILPLGGNGDAATPTVGPLQAFVAAREAVGDIAGMCERKPDVCETGRAALNTIGIHARAGVRLASKLLDDKAGSNGANRRLDRHGQHRGRELIARLGLPAAAPP